MSDIASDFLRDEDLSDGAGARYELVEFRGNFSEPLVGQDMQRMLNLTDGLRSVGAQSEIDIPQIAVIGDQSTGKSSLLHRMSGVPVQRSSGTCTRVPSEIILKESADGSWECTISIRYIRDASGTRLGKPRTEQFGSKMTNPIEVKDRMAHAQLACLNPSRPCSYFLNGPPSLRFVSENSFSDNCVIVQIIGPGVPNLSLCDLPGLIASVGKAGNETDIDMIKDLVASYISKSNCLILLTVSCETDFETQGAYRLATQYDPDGKRTLGVLTKPDRIASGDEDRWVKLVKNEEEQLDLGWFCVKQPDSKQVASGITLENVQTLEDDFFESVEPWRSLPFSARSRLGARPLVERLSQMLAELIAHRLPEVREEVERMIFETKNTLKDMPIPPSEDSLAEATVRVMEFAKEINLNVTGSATEEGLIHNLNIAQQKLKVSILSSAPEFLPYPKDSGCRILPDMEFLDKEGDGTFCGGITMHLDDITELMERARARELPGYISFDVPGKVIKRTMAEWPRFAECYYSTVLSILREFLKGVTKRHFYRYQNLYELAQRTIQELLKKVGEQTETHMDHLFQREETPFTLNSVYLNQYKNDFLAYYKSCRQRDLNGIAMDHIQDYTQLESSSANASAMKDNAVGQILSNLNKINIRDVKASDLPKLHRDPFDAALEVMATVSAYYQVASKRFIDAISLAVDYELIRAFANDISKALYESLNKGDARERCAIYMQEVPKIKKRREELRSRLERLEAAKQELTDYSPW
ncbi:hypothetical protein ACEPAH_7162 [Sanghuangporus vaninii]